MVKGILYLTKVCQAYDRVVGFMGIWSIHAQEGFKRRQWL